jgi:hypothetical protein
MNVEDIGHNGEVLVIGVEADVFLVGYGADKDVIPRDREPSGSELCEIPGSLAPDFLIVLNVWDDIEPSLDFIGLIRSRAAEEFHFHGTTKSPLEGIEEAFDGKFDAKISVPTEKIHPRAGIDDDHEKCGLAINGFQLIIGERVVRKLPLHDEIGEFADHLPADIL